jgi:hypothetical protein
VSVKFSTAGANRDSSGITDPSRWRNERRIMSPE